MATAILRPNGTPVNGNFSIGGGAASRHAATSDNSDTTYIFNSVGYPDGCELDFGTFAFPALAQIRSVTMRARVKSNPGFGSIKFGTRLKSGGAFSDYFYRTAPSAITTITQPALTTPPEGGSWSQAKIDAIRMRLSHYFSSADAADSIRFYEVYLDVVYNVAPVADPTAPAGNVTDTQQPTVVWSYTDTDGDAQERYRVKVFSQAQYAAGGFNPETSASTWDSGEVFSAAVSKQVATALANNTVYRAYVKAADVGSSGRYGAWDYVQFTILIAGGADAAPNVPVVTATAEPDDNRVELVLQGRDNLLTKNQAELETDASGWVADINVTIARSVAQAKNGAASLSLTATAGADMRARTAAGVFGVPVLAGIVYSAVASFRANTTGRNCRVLIRWYDAAGALLATTNGANVADTNAAWIQGFATAAAPANAAFATVVVEVLAAGAAEVHYADAVALMPTAAVVAGPGGLIYDEARDTFTRADSALVLGTSDDLHAWTAHSGTWGISTNRGYLVTATANAAASVQSGLANARVMADIKLSATANRAKAGLLFRFLDDNNWLSVDLVKVAGVDAVKLMKRSAGAISELVALTGYGLVEATTYWVEVVLAASLIEVYIDGVLKISYTLDEADAVYTTYTRHGLRIDNGAANDDGGSRFDNFVVSRLARQFLLVERSDDGGTTWTQVRDAEALDLSDDAQVGTFYDYEVPRDTAVVYRAQTYFEEATLVLASAFSATSGATVDLNGNWWLKDPLDSAANRVIEVADFRLYEREPQSVGHALGRRNPVVVSDGTKGDAGELLLRSRDQATYEALRAMLATSDVLLLQDVFGRQWYLRAGAERSIALVRAHDPSGTYPVRHLHEFTVPWQEVDAP